MTVALGFSGGILGFKTESGWGTAVTPDKFVEITDGDITKEIDQLHSEAINGIYMDDDEFSQGIIRASGSFEFEMRYEGAEVILYHAMGGVSSAETASFTVGVSNNKIDFNIGAGALVATVASSTYVMGATQATASSLCKAIYDAIVAAENTGTYTVSFSTTTNMMTITRSAGTFQILWKTGTNTVTCIAALIGFSTAADSTSALTYTSSTAVVPVYTHTFTMADALPTGITFELDEDYDAKTLKGGKIDKLALSLEPGGFMKCKLDVLGKDVTYAAATSATLSTSAIMLFSQAVVQYNAGTISVKSFELELNNNLDKEREYLGSSYIAQPQRSKKIEVTGKLELEFDAETQYDDFVAGTAREIILTVTGGSIKSGHTYTLTLTMSKCRVNSASRKFNGEGIITAELGFKAYATSSSTREMTIALKNTVVSVS